LPETVRGEGYSPLLLKEEMGKRCEEAYHSPDIRVSQTRVLLAMQNDGGWEPSVGSLLPEALK
jgi:hypothetical protein